jgi:hypothetical protein
MLNLDTWPLSASVTALAFYHTRGQTLECFEKWCGDWLRGEDAVMRFCAFSYITRRGDVPEGFDIEAVADGLTTTVAVSKLVELGQVLPPFAHDANIRAVITDCANYAYDFKDPEWW